MQVPMVLKDGADSVGVPGATLRVYINIGMYSQHWLQQHNALLGLGQQKPFEISTAQKNSVFWMATQEKFGNIAKFFTRLKPLRLADAPGGKAHLTKDDAVLQRGSIAFAENCAKCHSSKQPPAGTDADEWFAEAVLKDDFRQDNLPLGRTPLSRREDQNQRRHAPSARTRRADISGPISPRRPTRSFLPAIRSRSTIPTPTRCSRSKRPPGGPGYYRTPSLISLWTSAPFLHNNALGKFTGDPSVAGRMEAFNDAVEKLLWPEKTAREELDLAHVARMQHPDPGRRPAGRSTRLLKPHLDPDGYFRVGPIPAGTPVNLLANLNPDTDRTELVKLVLQHQSRLLKIKLGNLDSAAAKELMTKELAPALFAASKCPDLIEDRGHLSAAAAGRGQTSADRVPEDNLARRKSRLGFATGFIEQTRNQLHEMTFDDLKANRKRSSTSFSNAVRRVPIPEGDARGQAIVCSGTFWAG